MPSSQSEKGFWSKANGFILKWFGLFGIPFYIFFNKAAVDAKALDPEAGLGDIAAEFYGTVAGAAVNDFIPGTIIVISESFNFLADTILPGAGTVLSAVFSAVSEGSEIAHGANLIPTPSFP